MASSGTYFNDEWTAAVKKRTYQNPWPVGRKQPKFDTPGGAGAGVNISVGPPAFHTPRHPHGRTKIRYDTPTEVQLGKGPDGYGSKKGSGGARAFPTGRRKISYDSPAPRTATENAPYEPAKTHLDQAWVTGGNNPSYPSPGGKRDARRTSGDFTVAPRRHSFSVAFARDHKVSYDSPAGHRKPKESDDWNQTLTAAERFVPQFSRVGNRQVKYEAPGGKNNRSDFGLNNGGSDWTARQRRIPAVAFPVGSGGLPSYPVPAPRKIRPRKEEPRKEAKSWIPGMFEPELDNPGGDMSRARARTGSNKRRSRKYRRKSWVAGSGGLDKYDRPGGPSTSARSYWPDSREGSLYRGSWRAANTLRPYDNTRVIESTRRVLLDMPEDLIRHRTKGPRDCRWERIPHKADIWSNDAGWHYHNESIVERHPAEDRNDRVMNRRREYTWTSVPMPKLWRPRRSRSVEPWRLGFMGRRSRRTK